MYKFIGRHDAPLCKILGHLKEVCHGYAHSVERSSQVRILGESYIQSAIVFLKIGLVKLSISCMVGASQNH